MAHPCSLRRYGAIRRIFRSPEELGWELSGDGEHDYLYLEKSRR
jgi:hypothetical protein